MSKYSSVWPNPNFLKCIIKHLILTTILASRILHHKAIHTFIWNALADCVILGTHKERERKREIDKHVYVIARPEPQAGTINVSMPKCINIDLLGK